MEDKYSNMANWTHDELMAELKKIASMAFPGDVSKQHAEKIVKELRKRKT